MRKSSENEQPRRIESYRCMFKVDNVDQAMKACNEACRIKTLEEKHNELNLSGS